MSISSVGMGDAAMGLCCSIREFRWQRIVGYDIAHAVPLTLVARLSHWWLGSTDWLLLVLLPSVLSRHFCSPLADGIWSRAS
jgi:hypothetical protein